MKIADCLVRYYECLKCKIGFHDWAWFMSFRAMARTPELDKTAREAGVQEGDWMLFETDYEICTHCGARR